MAANRCQWCFSLCPYPQPAKYRWLSSNCIFTPTLSLISMFTTQFLGWRGDSHPRLTCKCCALPEPNMTTLCLEVTTHSIIITMTIRSLSDGWNGGLVRSGTRKAERKPSHRSQRHLKRGSQSSSHSQAQLSALCFAWDVGLLKESLGYGTDFPSPAIPLTSSPSAVWAS